MDNPAPPLLSHPLLLHGPFVRFLYVRVAASVALQMQAVAVGWQMYVLTGSSFQLGLVGLVQFVPAVALFLPTGHAADHYDRRMVTAAAQAVEAVAVAVLAASVAMGQLTATLVLAMAFIVGAGRAFEQPSLQSVLPNIVPPAVLPRAIAASNSAAQAAVVAGPALGGVLLAVNPAIAFAASAVLWLSAALIMLGIAMEWTPPRREPFDLKTMFSGVAFILRQKVVLGAILLDLFAVVLGNPTALLPIFASDIFKSGPLGFGALRAAPAAGAIISALILTRHPVSRRVGHAIFASVAIYGICTILLALSPTWIVAMAALFVLGSADLVSVVIRQTLVQLHTPDEMRGRVFAVNSMFTSTSNQLGTFRAGSAAALFGVIPAVLLGGLSTLVVVLISAGVFRELLRAEGYEPVKS
jgi:MFS family permease